MAPRRLLTIGHSYCVTLNRRMANAMAEAGASQWQVTVVAPASFPGDLGRIDTVAAPGEAARLELVPVHLTNRIHTFVYGRRLHHILREPWDLVHCWEEPYILAGGQITWWTSRLVPLVFWTWQNIVKRYPPPFAQIERYCLARCAGWVGLGNSVIAAQLQRGYGRKPYREIPHGIDLDRFQPDPGARARIRALLAWDDPALPVVGYVGRFVPEKGLALLMETLDRLNSPWRAMFVGGGPMESQLAAFSRRHGPQRARVITGVSHDQVADYLNALDVLCLPSQTTPRWREQYGRVILEAFACAVPVVASDSGGIPDAVGDAGIMLPEGDVTAWIAALDHLLAQPSIRADLAQRGLNRARQHYGWDAVARRHLEFFDQLLSHPDRRSS